MQFIWNLHPLATAIFIFIIDFGVIILLQVITKQKPLLPKWWSFKIGDSVFLPTFAFFTQIVVQERLTSIPLYENVLWHLGVFVIGLAMMTLQDVYLQKQNKIKPIGERTLASYYHSFIYIVMFYIIVSIFPVLLVDRTPFWAFFGAILALIGFLTIVVIDYFPFRPRQSN